MASVTTRVCCIGGGIPTQDATSSTGARCVGGSHDGKEIADILRHLIDTLSKEEFREMVRKKMEAEDDT